MDRRKESKDGCRWWYWSWREVISREKSPWLFFFTVHTLTKNPCVHSLRLLLLIGYFFFFFSFAIVQYICMINWLWSRFWLRFLGVLGVCFSRIYSNFGWFSLPRRTCHQHNHLYWCTISLIGLLCFFKFLLLLSGCYWVFTSWWIAQCYLTLMNCTTTYLYLYNFILLLNSKYH